MGSNVAASANPTLFVLHQAPNDTRITHENHPISAEQSGQCEFFRQNKANQRDLINKSCGKIFAP
jgi:hypothetical protein